MAKVITFSQRFPTGHPRAGQPTYFVEQVLNGFAQEGKTVSLSMLRELNKKSIQEGKLTEKQVEYFWDQLNRYDSLGKKIHTIRNGHRFNAGEKASLRVWLEKPYNSPQIIFAPETEVVKTYDFQIKANGVFLLHDDGKSKIFDSAGLIIESIAANDGLSKTDFFDWFKYPTAFDGQIICFQDPKY